MNWNRPSAEDVAALLCGMKLDLLVGQSHHVNRVGSARLGAARDRVDDPERNPMIAECQMGFRYRKIAVKG